MKRGSVAADPPAVGTSPQRRGIGTVDPAHVLRERGNHRRAQREAFQHRRSDGSQHAAQQVGQRARREGVRARTWADLDDLGLLGYVLELVPTNPSPQQHSGSRGARHWLRK